MNRFSNILKEIRKSRHISQNNMLSQKDRSQYNRIEKGITDLKFSTAEELCTKLGITLKEFVSLSNSDQYVNELVKQFRACCLDPNDEKNKEIFLKSYKHLELKTRDNMSIIEINLKACIQSILGNHWKEIPKIHATDIKYLYEHLSQTDFYGQFDYMLALNLVKHLNKDQLLNLVNKMFPISHYENRNDLSKQYSNLLITNVISYFIYEQEYKKALELVDLAQSHINTTDNYYLHLNLAYHRNLALRFTQNETKYIEKARNIIRIIEEIGDKSTARVFEEELNILNQTPDYFKNIKQYNEIVAST